MQLTTPQKLFAAVTALLAWFAIIAQWFLMLDMSKTSVGGILLQFFGFFTILSNLIVAITFTGVLSDPKWKLNRFFSKTTTQTAVTVYIIVVGAIYNLILRFLWQPQGLQWWVDELLHTALPLLTLVYWIVFVPKAGLRWKDSLWWMIYPFCYIFFVAVQGAASGYYPYPFINVTDIGYPRALVNAGGLVMVFMGLSLFLIAVAKYSTADKQQHPK
jgi:hypothetical protein